MQFAASFGPQAFDVWSENWSTFELFVAMGTQWAIGMGGATGLVVATGLRYEALPVLAGAMGIRLGRRRMAALQEMERAALQAMSEQRKQ